MQIKAWLLGTCLSAGLSTAAHAGLVGDSVQISEYYPTMTSLFSGPTPPQTVVSGGVTFFDVGKSLVDITVDNSTITLAASVSYTPNAAAFNGFDIQDLNLGRTITGVTLDAMSGPLPAGDLSFDAHDVWVNLAAVPLDSANPIIIDVATPSAGVPEPATWALMLLGFTGLGAALRSRRKSLAA
ncbi:MAG TPA: PEPxxWA-CTERM sorting domain-containing protein [Caulobacteraceae bacterium]|nr:PEPxxWA-CTERM sorting domain-containing protein [Caulobacteraceae bacterium]